MPKPIRPLGSDPVASKPAAKHFHGVSGSEFPQKSLEKSLDDLLDEQDLRSIDDERGAPQAVKTNDDDLGFLDIPCDRIVVSPFQPRLEFSDEPLQLLAESIATTGRVNRPIIVRPIDNGMFELIAGERRWRSVQFLGWKTIPGRVIDVGDDDAEILATADNKGQEGLSDYEDGKAYKRILDRGNVKGVRALASKVGVSHPTISRCLTLTKLPPECLEFLDANPRTLGGKLAGEYVAIAATHPALVLEALIKIDQEGLSQEQGLRWLYAKQKELSGEQGKDKKRTHTIILKGGKEAKVTVSGNTIQLKVPKGESIDELEQKLIAAMSDTK